MKNLFTITCLAIMTNITFSQHQQLGEDIFLNSYGGVEVNSEVVQTENESVLSSRSQEVNLNWNTEEKINKIILIKEDYSDITIIGGEFKQGVLVKDLTKGLYHVGYFLDNTCVTTSTIVVGSD